MLNMYRIDVNIFLYLLNFPPRPHYFPVLEPSLANGGLQCQGWGLAKDLIKKLLVKDSHKRLGNMKLGALDVMNHK